MLSTRQQHVLRAIVLDYIASAEPVGSRTISKKYDLGVSSATIRNEMADLEDAGYIHQPHTSAGRVPTDEGYRYFVETLMPELLAMAANDEVDVLRRWMASGYANDETMRLALLRYLAKRSHYPSFLMLSATAGSEEPVLALLNLQFLAPGRILMVAVTDDEQLHNEIIEASLSVTPQNLAMVNGLLNHYLRGLPAKYWATPLGDFLYNQEGYLAKFIKDVVHRIGAVLAAVERRKIYLEGTLNMLDQPEFQDIDKMRNLLAMLTVDDRVAALLEDLGEQTIYVRIGLDEEMPGMCDCSLILSSYRIGSQIGHLGFIGPKRMDYMAAARLLQAAAKVVEETFGERTMLVPERQTDLAPLLHSFAWQLRDNG